MPEYKVRQGDSIASIAFYHGLFPEAIWNHPRNADLKKQQREPNILFPGDVVFVPEKQPKQESVATEQRHRFRRKGVPEKVRIRIVEEEPVEEVISSETDSDTAPGDANTASSPDTEQEREPVSYRPRANIPYLLEIDGMTVSGTSDDDGIVEYGILPNAKVGRLIVDPGKPDEWSIPLQLGHLNPLTKLGGVKQRLRSLGFDCGDCNEQETPKLEEQLKLFQQKQGLDVTGRVDEQTRAKLKELHEG